MLWVRKVNLKHWQRLLLQLNLQLLMCWGKPYGWTEGIIATAMWSNIIGMHSLGYFTLHNLCVRLPCCSLPHFSTCSCSVYDINARNLTNCMHGNGDPTNWYVCPTNNLLCRYLFPRPWFFYLCSRNDTRTSEWDDLPIILCIKIPILLNYLFLPSNTHPPAADSSGGHLVWVGWVVWEFLVCWLWYGIARLSFLAASSVTGPELHLHVELQHILVCWTWKLQAAPVLSCSLPSPHSAACPALLTAPICRTTSGFSCEIETKKNKQFFIL